MRNTLRRYLALYYIFGLGMWYQLPGKTAWAADYSRQATGTIRYCRLFQCMSQCCQYDKWTLSCYYSCDTFNFLRRAPIVVNDFLHVSMEFG